MLFNIGFLFIFVGWEVYFDGHDWIRRPSLSSDVQTGASSRLCMP